MGCFAPDTAAALHAERFLEALGTEAALVDGARSLGAWVKSLRMRAVGAHLLTCSDETESEAAQTFDRHFVRHLLPNLHAFDKAPFRSANLGGRYEWGSLAITEEHFARAKHAQSGKVVVLKVNAHVAVEQGPDGLVFGKLARYDSVGSATCGALAGLLSGDRSRPFLLELEESFLFEGVDRVAQLRAMPEDTRALVAAIISARLQARRAMLDIQDLQANSPTAYMIVASVTLNRTGRDAELPIGMYLVDHLGDERSEHWIGVTDRPDEIKLRLDDGLVAIEHKQLRLPRPARDHRELLRTALGERSLSGTADKATALARLNKVGEEHPVAKATLKAMAPLLLEFAPVPAAAALFGVGVLSVHHTARAHRLLDEARSDQAARQMLSNLSHEIDGLSPEQAERALALLRHELGA